MKLKPLLLVPVVLMAGCSTANGSSDDPQTTSNGLVVLVGDGTSEGKNTKLKGEVMPIGDCLGMVRDGLSYAVVWPTGTKATGDGVSLPSGAIVGARTAVAGKGRLASLPLPDSLPEVPKDCVGSTGEVVVLSKVEPAKG